MVTFGDPLWAPGHRFVGCLGGKVARVGLREGFIEVSMYAQHLGNLFCY